MPTTGPGVTQIDDMQSPYSQKLEVASPGYYQVRLLQWDIDAKLSATEHTGITQFTFPAGKAANILVPISHTLDNVTGAEIHVRSRALWKTVPFVEATRITKSIF